MFEQSSVQGKVYQVKPYETRGVDAALCLVVEAIRDTLADISDDPTDIVVAQGRPDDRAKCH
jgi:hypothetical protein